MERSFAHHLVVALVVALCAAAGFAIWVVLTGTVEGAALQGLGSALAAVLCGVTGLAGATVLECDDARHSVGLVTILISGFEFALLLAAIWTRLGSEPLQRALIMCTALLPAFVHASLMLGRVRGDDGRAVRSLTAAAVTSSMLGAALLGGAFAVLTGSPGSGYWRLLGVLAVLGTLFTLLALIAPRLDGRRGAGGQAAQPSGPGAGPGAGPGGSQPPLQAGTPRIRRALVVHPAHAARVARREPAAD